MNHRKTTLRVVLQHLVLLLMCIALCSVRTQAASVYFNNVYQGAGTGYTTSSSPVANITLLAGTGFRFTSLNPDVPNFVADAGGNDIRGTLSYVNPQGRVVQISGIVSRLDKINGVPAGFYFVDPVNGRGYLLVLAGSENMYRPGLNVRTSSESSLLTSLNTTVSEQQSEPRLNIANTSAAENVGLMVFTLTVSPAAASNFSFTPTLTAGTAISGTDFTTSMQYNIGGGWVQVTGPIHISASVTSFQIRVPLLDDNAVENNETFILNSGPITGGNFLNYQGTFGEATILDNDGNPAPIAQNDVVYTYGDAPFSLRPTSPNTTGSYTYSIIGQGGVVTQQTGTFTILGVGVTQVIIYQAPGDGYGMGSKVITVTVLPAALQVMANDKRKIYDGLPFSGGNGVTYNGLKYGESSSVLSGTLQYSGSSQNAVAAGTYTLTPGGLSGANYTITYVSGQLLVQKAPLTITAADEVKTYDGQPYSGGNGVSYSGFVAGETTAVLQGALSYGGNAQGAKNVATYAITPAGFTAANYEISYVNGRLIIDPAPLTIAAQARSKVYDGQVYGGAHAVSYNGFVAGDNETNALAGTLSYAGNWQGATAAGMYTIAPHGQTAANYTITYAGGTLFINKATLTATVLNQSKNYDGQVYSAGYSLSYSGFVNGENQSVLIGTPIFGGNAQAAVAAGSYTITAGGLSAANYNINYVPGMLTINRLALVVRVNSLAKTYDAQPFSGGNGVSFTGFVAGENQSVLGGSLSFGGIAQGAVNVGNYTITASGYTAANYTISYVPGTLVISPATLLAKLAPAEKVYDGQPWQGGGGISFSGFVPGEDTSVVSGNPTYGGTAQGVRQAGTYTLTLSGLQAANYTISYEPATLTIRPAPLTVQVHDARKLYDGRPYAGSHGVSYAGFVAGETPAVLSGTLVYNGNWSAAINAGTYQIVPGGLASVNYAINYLSGNLEIARAPLLVTAENKSKTYDAQPFNPAGYAVRYQGFVAGEDERQLSGRLLYGGTAAAAINAGSYAIMPEGLSAANYEPRFAAGTLVINKAPLVVTALEHSKVYDGQPFPAAAFKVSYNGLVEGEQPVAVLQGDLQFTGSGVGATDAGSYVVQPAGLSAANYDIRYGEGLLTIRKANPVLVLPDVVKTYGDADFRLSPPLSKSSGKFSFGLANDTVALLSGTTVKIRAAGTTPITVWQAEDRNYNAAAASARMIVHKAPLTVIANAAYRCVNDSNPTLSCTIKGFVNRENASVLMAMPEVYTAATPQSPAGTYPILVSGGEAANYEFRYVPASIKVSNPVRWPVELPLVAVVAGERAELAARPFGIKYEWLPATGLSAPTSATTQLRVLQDQEYTIRITESTGCVVADRVKVRVFDQAGTYVPSAFSPNGDGKNDLLRVIGPGLEKLHYFRVFNRFGQMLFETTELGKGWDGTFKGAPQPEDTYVWVLMAQKKTGGKLEGKGFVIIVR